MEHYDSDGAEASGQVPSCPIYSQPLHPARHPPQCHDPILASSNEIP